MAGVSSISLTNVGKLYTSIPTITLSAPTAPYGDSATASGTLTITNGKVSSFNVSDSGGYYLSAPSVTLTNNFDLINLQDSDAKFSNYSYEFGKDDIIDINLTQFTNTFGETYETDINVKLEFWLYVQDSQKGDFLKFEGIGDELEQDGSFNKVRVDGRRIHWFFTATNTETSLRSYELLNYGEWNFVQLTRTPGSPPTSDWNAIYINDSAGQFLPTSTGAYQREPIVKESITLVNSSGITGVKIDAIRFLNNATIVDIPDSDRDPGTGINYEGFNTSDPEITALITNNRLSGITIVDSGERLISSTVIFSSPTGTPADFTAEASAIIDSSAGTITSINITDSGDFYTSAPTVTITAPTTPKNFIIGETVNQTLSSGVVMQGEVSKWSDSDNKLHLIHIGGDDGKYHTFATTTGATPVITGLTSNASGVITTITEDNQIASNEQNDNFDTIGLDFLDFTETNPFGDPN